MFVNRSRCGVMWSNKPMPISYLYGSDDADARHTTSSTGYVCTVQCFFSFRFPFRPCIE